MQGTACRTRKVASAIIDYSVPLRGNGKERASNPFVIEGSLSQILSKVTSRCVVVLILAGVDGQDGATVLSFETPTDTLFCFTYRSEDPRWIFDASSKFWNLEGLPIENTNLCPRFSPNV